MMLFPTLCSVSYHAYAFIATNHRNSSSSHVRIKANIKSSRMRFLLSAVVKTAATSEASPLSRNEETFRSSSLVAAIRIRSMTAFAGIPVAVCVLSILSSSVLPTSASLAVPALLLSPLGAPGAMGPAGVVAAKLAIGTKLLNMLGYLGAGGGGNLLSSPIDTLQRFPFLGFNFPNTESFPEEYRALPITPKSKEFSKRRGPNIPTMFNIRDATPTEVENFFGVLDRVDANRCISRLVCEIGANPKVLEGLGHNVKEVISSLQVLEKNKLSTKYREILLLGQRDGIESCAASFPTCDAKSYRMAIVSLMALERSGHKPPPDFLAYRPAETYPTFHRRKGNFSKLLARPRIFKGDILNQASPYSPGITRPKATDDWLTCLGRKCLKLHGKIQMPLSPVTQESDTGRSRFRTALPK